jgi:hypothetical protein
MANAVLVEFARWTENARGVPLTKSRRLQACCRLRSALYTVR